MFYKLILYRSAYSKFGKLNNNKLLKSTRIGITTHLSVKMHRKYRK